MFGNDSCGDDPERFVRKAAEVPALPALAWINRPAEVSPTTQ